MARFINCVYCPEGQEVCSTCVRRGEIFTPIKRECIRREKKANKAAFIAACVKEVQQLTEEEIEF